jgi:hypothetical protein
MIVVKQVEQREDEEDGHATRTEDEIFSEEEVGCKL